MPILNEVEGTAPRVTLAEVWRAWFPLAMSWLLMAAELPFLTLMVARVAFPEIHLAAYGGIVFPMALVIESPVIMLLSASTALCRDAASYDRLRRFMMGMGGVLTGVHALVAFSPLFDWVVEVWFRPPPEIVEPARLGFQVMLPWTWAIAHRRFHQGILIRWGLSSVVGWGTACRLMANAVVLGYGVWVGTLAGILMAAGAVIAGVVIEMTFVYAWVRGRLRREYWQATDRGEGIEWSALLRFYYPLAMTSFIGLVTMPIVTAGMGRMPLTLESLAAWPAIHGVVFIHLALGLAFTEVVVAFSDRPGGFPVIRKFMVALSLGATLLLAAISWNGISEIWFREVSSLPPGIAEVAMDALKVAVLLPGLNVVICWIQGRLVYGRQTAVITKSVLIFMVVLGLGLWMGIEAGRWPGAVVGLVSYTVGRGVQMGWLLWRCGAGIRA